MSVAGNGTNPIAAEDPMRGLLIRSAARVR